MAREKSSKAAGDESGVREHDENYIGTDPVYQNSAYEVTAPIVDSDATDEVAERVKEHEAAMAQPEAVVKSFEDWNAERKALHEGVTEEARDLDVEGRSSMTKDELAAAVEAARQQQSS